MENLDWVKAYEDFRQLVDNVSKDRLVSKNSATEMFEYWEKRKKGSVPSFDLEYSTPCYELCKRLKIILDSDLMKGLRRLFAELGIPLRNDLLDQIEDDCRKTAEKWSAYWRVGLPDCDFKYDVKEPNYIMTETIPLFKIERIGTRFKIENRERQALGEGMDEFVRGLAEHLKK